MELKELHVDQLRAGVVGERLTITGVLPRIRGHLPRFSVATRRQNHSLRSENNEPARLSPVGNGAADSAVLLERPTTVHSMKTSMPW